MHPLFEAATLRRSAHPNLRPFISHYVYRSMYFPREYRMRKVMPVRLQSSIDFYIGDSFDTLDYNSGSTIPFERCTIRGPRTRKLYVVKLKGHFVSFVIKFKPTGLYNLTGLSMMSCTNGFLTGTSLPALPLAEITRQLLHVRDVESCIELVEPHLLHLAASRVGRRDVLEAVIKKMEEYNDSDPVSQWAAACHLSVRQLERIFIREVGISPKTFYRLHRFEKLIRSKIDQPYVKWSAMASEFGYADQMHLIREFKQFLGITPSRFVPTDFAF